MDQRIEPYLKGLKSYRPKTTRKFIEETMEKAGVTFPEDYIAFMEEMNGIDGKVGKGSLILYPIEEILDNNYTSRSFLSEVPTRSIYYLIGDNGAGTDYVFHKKNHTYHRFDKISDWEEEPVEWCGNDFGEFIRFIYEGG